MGYTVTFDASHKVKAGGSHVKGYLRHCARDADEKQGIFTKHSNQNIVPSRTKFNTTLVTDGKGGYKLAQGSDELEAALDARLGTVKKKMRKDATVMRPLILQLDPKFFEEVAPDWRENGEIGQEANEYTAAMFRWAQKEFGAQNIIGGSIHLDEYSPQLHVFFTPVTDDGRLSQKDFFKGPKHLQVQRARLLDELEAIGYEPERKVSARSKEHLSSQEYAAKADKARDELEEAKYIKEDAKASLAHAHRESTAVGKVHQEARQARLKAEAAQEVAQEAQRLAEASRREYEALKASGYEDGKAEGRAEGLRDAASELKTLRDAKAQEGFALGKAIFEGKEPELAELMDKMRDTDVVNSMFQLREYLKDKQKLRMSLKPHLQPVWDAMNIAYQAEPLRTVPGSQKPVQPQKRVRDAGREL